MNKHVKRIISALLAVCLVLTAAVTAVHFLADENGFFDLSAQLAFGNDLKKENNSSGSAAVLSSGENLQNVNVLVSGTDRTVKVGDSVQLLVNCTSAGSGVPSDITYTYLSLTPSLATVDENGLVDAQQEGEASIQVTATSGGAEVGQQIATLSIVASDAAAAASNDTFTNPSGVKFTIPIMGDLKHSRDIKTVTYDDTADAWMYYGISANYNLSIFAYYYKGIQANLAREGTWFAIKIKVDNPGEYLMNQRYGVGERGCIGGIYVLPGDTEKAQIASQLTDNTKIGTVDFYDPDSQYTGRKNLTTAVGIVNFPTAGEYLLVYKVEKVRMPGGAQYSYMHVADITFDGVNCLKTVAPEQTTIDLTINKNNSGAAVFGTHQLKYDLIKLDGTLLNAEDCIITHVSYDDDIVTVDENGLLTARNHGATSVKITAYDGVESHSAVVKVNVTDNSGVADVYVDMDSTLYVRETTDVYLSVKFNSGGIYRLPQAQTSIVVSNPGMLTVNSGTVKVNREGSAIVKAVGTFLGEEVTAQITVTAEEHPGKTEPTYYTYSMRNAAQENIKKYTWASSSRNSAKTNADKYLSYIDQLYHQIPYEGIPRSRQMGYQNATKWGYCRYCGCNVMSTYGASGVGGWKTDVLNHPWKIGCPDCKNWFPSNDFESFYKLGLDENGRFDYYKAYEENDKLIAAGHEGYLVNISFPDKDKTWGVDDGYGYRAYTDGTQMSMHTIRKANGTLNPVKTSNMDLDESACYIPMYMYESWYDYRSLVTTFATAYLYTGDVTYARAGAILLDRITDVMPSYDIQANQLSAIYYSEPYGPTDYVTSCGGAGYGMFAGRIEDNNFCAEFAMAADAFFPALGDPALIRYLSKEAKAIGLENTKRTSELIWKNWEENLLIETFTSTQAGQTLSNYGMAQRCVALAAVVLAREPETTEMLNWIWKIDNELMSSGSRTAKGGHLAGILFDQVSRDGLGDEAAVGYNAMWIRTLHSFADVMVKYQTDEVLNPYDHPRFVNMFLNYDALILSESHHAQIGDSGAVASLDFGTQNSMYIAAWKQLKNTPLAKRLAQTIYVTNGYSVSNLSYGIYSSSPYSIQSEIMAYVDPDAEHHNDMLPGFGYSVLRDGYTGRRSTQRSAWMYYGFTAGHGHEDTLNIGLEAFGLNLSPDLGYPTNTIGDPTNQGWLRTTLAHNTVVVDGESQRDDQNVQFPYIMDESAYVSVMGVETDLVYRQVDEYKRTVVMIKFDDNRSYMVDFFHVRGGDQHTYSFHAQSHQTEVIDGLEVVKQVNENGEYVGTYAGADIERGKSGSFAKGYNYLTKVRKDSELETNQFTVDFAITDYRNAVSDNKNIHLRMTQINNFIPDEVAIAGGFVPIKKDNSAITKVTDTLEYVLTQREAAEEGEELDSVFTTVFEPYKKRSSIKSIVPVSVSVVSGTPGQYDSTSALKITHTNDRVDYVFYSENKDVIYRVDNLFNVRGYVALYSFDQVTGEEIVRYVTGGDIIVTATNEVGVYKGKVMNYSKELTLYNNYIDVDLSISLDEAQKLVGQYIYVENDGTENAAYKIEGVSQIAGGIRLDLGVGSVIRGLRDKSDANGGYTYNIAKGQRFEIPMHFTSTTEVKTPKIEVANYGLTHDVWDLSI